MEVFFFFIIKSTRILKLHSLFHIGKFPSKIKRFIPGFHKAVQLCSAWKSVFPLQDINLQSHI